MPNILIIEDNNKLAVMIQQYLLKKGIDADISLDGVSGLRSFASKSYDLLLVDLKLPLMTGDAVCKKVRESSKGRGLPIILMSGFVKEPVEIERFTKELDLSGFLIKPFPSEKLFSMITSSLQKKDSTEAPSHKATEKPPLRFKGNIEKTPCPHLLLYIMKKNATGMLHLTDGAQNRNFFFMSGAPVELTLSDKGDDFGNYLLQKNLISLTELREYEDRKGSDEGDPREIFVKMGCLTPEQFQEENMGFLADRLIECCSWKTGLFSFETRPSFLNILHAARAFLPRLIFSGLKKSADPSAINSFLDHKGKLYIGRTLDFYEFQNHLISEPVALEVFNLIDGTRTCSEILSSVEADNESAASLLYALDHLKMLSFSNKPQDAEPAPPFPVRERQIKASAKEQEKFEDMGEELHELADELEDLGGLTGPSQAFVEDAELSQLEGELKREWESVADKNYYEIFGMTANTFSFDNLKKSYFELTKRYGPEKFFASSSEVMGLAEEFLSKISNAYNTLSNVVSKENYDELLSSQEVVPSGGEEELKFHLQIQFQSGKVFLEQGQFESAEKAFTSCLNLEPDKPEYLAYLAVAIYNNPVNRKSPTLLKRAKDLVNKSLQMGKLSIAYALKGTMLLDEGNLNLAEAEFNKALKLNPNNKTASKKIELIREKRELEKKGLFQRMFK